MKDYTRIARKITIVLFLSQSLSSAGFIAGAVDPGHMGGRRPVGGSPHPHSDSSD